MPATDRRRRLTAFVVAMAVLVATPLAVVAADAFTDVPNSNVFHDDIAWLADAGVTKGCNPPDNTEFCPSDNVTREQMSAFMRRLAQYMDAEDGTPALADNANNADNADTLNGKNGTAYQTRVASSSCGVTVSDDGLDIFTSCIPPSGGLVGPETNAEVFKVQITVPTAGALQVSSTALSDATLSFQFRLDSTCPATTIAVLNGALNNHIWGNAGGFSTGAHLTTSVPAGSHTVRLCGFNSSTTNPVQLLTGSLDVQWTAGGSVEVAGGSTSPVERPTLLGG